jgi:hypothetical protein
VQITSAPVERHTSSNTLVNLLSRSRIRNFHAPQEDRVDGEQVAGHDPGGLLAQERPPARCSAPGRRVKTVGAQYPPDRAGRHPQAKTEQLTVDPLVAPPRILAGKPHDQLLHLV